MRIYDRPSWVNWTVFDTIKPQDNNGFYREVVEMAVYGSISKLKIAQSEKRAGGIQLLYMRSFASR